MTGVESEAGVEALLALIDDLRARVAEMEKVVHDGNVHAFAITADELDVGGQVLAHSVRVNAGPDGAQATLEASEDFVEFKLKSKPGVSEGVMVNLTASAESGEGHASVGLYRKGNGLAAFELFGDVDRDQHTALWLSEPDAGGQPELGASAGASDLARLTRPLPSPTVSERVTELETWKDEMAERVVTRSLEAEQVEVRRADVDPHVIIGVERGGLSVETVTGKPVPAYAFVQVMAAEDTPGVLMEASSGHPRRRDLGEIEIASTDPRQPSIRLADGGAHFQCPDGGGRIDLGTSADWATLYLRAKDDDRAPTIGLHTDLEGADERRRPAGEATVVTRHNDQDLVRLGSHASAGRPGAGYLTVAEGGERPLESTDRIRLAVRGGQAGLDLLSPTGDDFTMDAGPEGAALAIKAPGHNSWEQWLDKDGLSAGTEAS